MKILFIVSRVPYPLEKGDKLRAFNHLRLLSEKHEITLVALNNSKLDADARKVLSAYCKNLHIFDITWFERVQNLLTTLFNGHPFSTGYFYNGRIQAEVNTIVNSVKPDHIFCQLTRVSEYVKNINNIPKTLDYQDAFAKGMEKRIAKEPFYKRWVFRMEHNRLLKYEAAIFNEFENKIIISAQDRENIKHTDSDKIVVVPNGVDLDYYQPIPGEKKYDLLFTGNMAYPPNIESVVFLVNKVLPLVKKSKPGIKLLIAGANPVSRVLALKSENVVVSGWVDDMRECYASTRLFIAPMQISIGLQNKLLEAMAMQVPCITSGLANNALGGTDTLNVLVCKHPQEYADAILKLLDNPAEAKKLADAGNEFVKENYGWKKMTVPLLRLIETPVTV